MTQLTNSKCVCGLVFVPVADILNIFCDVNLFSLYLMNFMFYTMLDAACNIQRVHYKSIWNVMFLFSLDRLYGHLTECITDALSKTVLCGCYRATRQPCGTVSLHYDTTATRRCHTAFLSRRYALCDHVTFWPNIHWWARYRDGLSLCQVWRFGFKPFWFYRADRHTYRHTDRITEADDRYTDATTVGVSNNIMIWSTFGRIYLNI